MKASCTVALLSLLSAASTRSVAAIDTDDSVSCFDGASAFFSTDDWDFCHQIRPDLLLYYKPLPDEGNVVLGLHATQDTFGWSSLALAGNGGMKGASQIVVRRREDDNNNEWIAEDRNSQDFTTPTLDESQDVKLLFANQTEDTGETAWGILLPMNSCDEHDYPILNITTFMLWALGDDHTFGFHGSRRGQFHINLLAGPSQDDRVAVERTVDDSQSIEFIMPNVSVAIGKDGADPSNPYTCSVFNLEKMRPEEFQGDDSSKVHVTRISPILDEDAKAYVHHMILYSCTNSDFEHLQVISNCQSMPSGCTEMKVAWAVGGEDVVLPEDVGLPFGEDGQRVFLLQTHYYNPSLHENINDSSGFRAYFTKDLRAQEAGIMQVNGGTSPSMRPPIPAGQSAYDLATFVYPSRCTADNWAEPINILGVAHHMHMMGTKMTIDVERDGQALGRLRNEMHYDFNHQSLVESPIKQLLPGDQLIMNCRYDTTGQDEDVSFGDFTQQEMCYSVMLYYPKQRDDSVGYLSLDFIGFNSTQCYTPASGIFAQFDLSECTQKFTESIPSFLNLEITRLGATEDFGAVEMCNSDFYEEDIMRTYPGLCPDCYKSKNCTDVEVVTYGQLAVCPYYCTRVAGVSVYPNVSDTVEFNQGVYGCNVEDSTNGVVFFEAEEPKPQPVCKRIGNHTGDGGVLVPEAEITTGVSRTGDETSTLEMNDSSGISLPPGIWTAFVVAVGSAFLVV